MTAPHRQMRVVVVGAGISGLATAYLLKRNRPELQVIVLERDAREGGVIRTERTAEGFVWEAGPDSLVTFKPEGMQLMTELGLLSDLGESGDGPRGAFVLRQGRLVPLPEGLQGALPSSPWGMLSSPLFSWGCKLRMGLEPVVPRRRATADESVAAFVGRRFGPQVLDRLVAPLLGGIHACPPQVLSARAVLGPYVDYEARFGSVARGMASTRARGASRKTLPAGPAMVTLRSGMAMLTARLAEAIGTGLQLAQAVTAIERTPDQRFLVALDSGQTVAADAVVLACPPLIAAKLVGSLCPALAAELEAIAASDVLHVSLAWPRAAIPHPLRGTGYVVPTSEPSSLSACTFMSHKWSARAPSSHETFRCFMRDCALSDAQAITDAVTDLQRTLHIDGPPSQAHVTRLPRALPRYEIGHVERVARIREQLDQVPGLAVAGNAYVGLGIPDCIRSAQLAVERLQSIASEPAVFASSRSRAARLQQAEPQQRGRHP